MKTFSLLTKNLESIEQKLENLLLYVDYLPFGSTSMFRPILMKDGALIVLFEMVGVDYEGLSEQEKAQLCYYLRCALEQLPDDGAGFMLSSTLVRERAECPTLDMGGAGTPDVIRAVQGHKQTFWKEIAATSYTNKLYYCLRYYAKPQETPWYMLVQDNRRFTFLRKKLEEQAEHLYQGYRAIVTGMERFGIRQLDEEKAFRILYRLVNRTDPPRYRPDLSLGAQLAASQIRIHPFRHVDINGMHTAVVGLHYPPEYTQAIYFRRFYELPFPVVLKQTMGIESKYALKKSMEWKKGLATSLAPHDKSCAMYCEEIKEYYDRIERGKEYPIWWSFLCQVEGRSEKELNDRAGQVCALIKEIGGAGHVDKPATKTAYFAMMPGHERLYARKSLIASGDAGDLLSAFNLHQGDRNPVEYFQDRLNGIFAYDPFTTREAAHHTAITGPTGSGKSFMAQKLLLSTLVKKPRYYVIDLSNSFTELFGFLREEMPDQTSIMTVSSQHTDVACNPFRPKDPTKPPTEEEMNYAMGLLRVMAGDTIRPGQEMDLRKGLEKFYREYNVLLGPDGQREIPPITLLADIMDTEVHQKELAQAIQLWTIGRKGKVFNTGRDTMTAARYSLFDLADLDQDEILVQALVYSIFGKIYRECTNEKDRATPKILVMDEAHRYLRHPAFAFWLELLFRIGRHYNLMVCVVTQSIKDLISEESWSKGLIENLKQAWFFGGQKAIDAELAKFQVTPYQIQQYYELQPQHREVYYWSASRLSRVLRPVTDPHTYWLATTDPQERVIRSQIREACGGDIARAIEICVEQTAGISTPAERVARLRQFMRENQTALETAKA